MVMLAYLIMGCVCVCVCVCMCACVHIHACFSVTGHYKLRPSYTWECLKLQSPSPETTMTWRLLSKMKDKIMC